MPQHMPKMSAQKGRKYLQKRQKHQKCLGMVQNIQKKGLNAIEWAQNISNRPKLPAHGQKRPQNRPEMPPNGPKGTQSRLKCLQMGQKGLTKAENASGWFQWAKKA